MEVFFKLVSFMILFCGLMSCQFNSTNSVNEQKRWDNLSPDQKQIMQHGYEMSRKKELMNAPLEQAERMAR